MSSELVLKVHRVRFFIAELSSINCMSYNEDNQKLALIRRRIRKYKSTQTDTQSVVQIWNMQTKAPFVEQTIYDDSDNPSLLESLLWTPKGRLFSCGLNTNINEYNLTDNRIEKSYNGRSGPIWCMALDTTKSLIVVGTEDGGICIYRIEDNGLEFDKIIDRNDCRILCIEWYRPEDNNSSQLIITGSIDYIKIWDYQTGRCVDHIQVGNNGVVVWCLTVLQDFTIISGDSKGMTSFWNGKTSALVTSYHSHKGDVLCICVDSDQTTVYSSGVDPDISQLRRTLNKPDSWVSATTRRLHTHDVRAMTCVRPNWLISGGIDSYLTRSCYPPSLQLRHLSDYSSNVTIIKDYVLLSYETFVQIWKLGKSEDDVIQTEDTIEILPLFECASKLADIKSRKPITTASFNDNWIVYSNSDNIRIKSWSKTGIKKVPVLCEPIVGATQIAFCGLNFVVISSGTLLNVLKLDVMGVSLQTRLDFEHRIYSMTTSDKYLVVSTADPRNTIRVYKTDDWTLYCEFVNNSLPTCLKINESSGEADLWIAYSNHKLVNYRIQKKKYFKTINVLECIPSEMKKSIDEFWTIKQIFFATNSVLFSDDNTLFKLDTKTDEIKKCDKYQHIIKLGNGSASDELVVVELTPDMLFSYLPKSLAKKRFGV